MSTDLSEKPTGVGADLVGEHFAKVGLKIPKGMVFKETSRSENTKFAEAVPTDFKQKVGCDEETPLHEQNSYIMNSDKKITFAGVKTLKNARERRVAKLGKPLEPYFCNQCNFNAVSSKMLKSHNLYKHQEREALCDQCDKRFFTNEHLQNHINAVHEITTHSCSSCSFKTVRKRLLVVHVQRNHAEKHLLCSECSYVCSDAGFLRLHIGRHHTDKTKWPQCQWPGCNYTSWPEKNVKNHYKKEHEGIRYKCNICSKTFTARANMHAHKLKIHKDLLKSDNRSKTTTRASFDARYTFQEDISLGT